MSSHPKLSESMAHQILKQKAIEWLRERGYDVLLEYRVTIERHVFEVDVAGFKDKESVAIECGRTNYIKIEKLRTMFKIVKQFKYTGRIYPKMRDHYISQISVNKAISKVFQKGKTQVPLIVRNSLRLIDGDKLLWFAENGKIVVELA